MYIASLSLGKLSWNTTNIWCHFIFLCDQNRHIRLNSIQSLQYLHLFTCTCSGLLFSVLRFTVGISISFLHTGFVLHSLSSCKELSRHRVTTLIKSKNFWTYSKIPTDSYFKCVLINFCSFQSGTTLLLLLLTHRFLRSVAE